MPAKKHPFTPYQSVLEPWTRLAMSAPAVINLRMISLPWLFMTDPLKATVEMQRMVNEKQEAWSETVVAVSQAPMHLWFDMWAACWSSQPHNAINKAMINSSRRMALPASSRVNANQRRLSRSHR